MMQEVRFKCKCMPCELPLFVRSRFGFENILDYMRDVVQVEIATAHSLISPLCQTTKMEYAKIPVEEGRPIGCGVQINER